MIWNEVEIHMKLLNEILAVHNVKKNQDNLVEKLFTLLSISFLKESQSFNTSVSKRIDNFFFDDGIVFSCHLTDR